MVENFATSEIETYDDLTDVYDLYKTLSNNEELNAFKFLTRWDELDKTQKLSFYDIYQCNEVNLFIRNKDAPFFKEVVKPLLTNKAQKGFIDLYLLGLDKELAAYATSTVKYQSLNTFERILLASRQKDLVEPTLKYLTDSLAGQPVLPQEPDSLFQAALEAKQSSADYMDQWMSQKYQFAGEAALKSGEITHQSREFQETRYFRVSFDKQTADLVTPSRFWLDYAKNELQGDSKNFLSKEFHSPTGNLTQMLLGLAVLGLPFRSAVTDPKLKYKTDIKVQMTVSHPTIVLSKQIKESAVESSALSVSTNYFDPEEPFEIIDFEKQDKFLKMPLLTQKVYGCRVVITNVSSMSHTVEILSQIPTGAIPVRDGFRTRNSIEELDPYTTKHREFFFYFPSAGKYTHYQTRVSKNGKVIGFGKQDPEIVVVDPETIADTSSWEYYSQKADKDTLLKYLKESPEVHKVDLSKIAWRMMEESMFKQTTTILRDRYVYNEAVWAYSLKHYAQDEVKEYLSMQPKFLKAVSPDLSTKSVLSAYDAYDRQTFQVMEYWPLTSSRTHKLSFDNSQFQSQYREFLKRALYRSHNVDSLHETDKMTAVYYFLVQNQTQKALDIFEKVNEEEAKKVSGFTYDYLRAYLSLTSGNVSEVTNASELSDKYKKLTLTPSRAALWQGVSEYLEELKDSSFADESFDPTTEADIASARARSLDCDVNSDRTITIHYKNVNGVEINFYQTDVELQFSNAPFRKEHNAYNFVTPTETINEL
eukprot:UN31238